ncbi:hypothetical protein DKAM_0357 [Desulfurococcus amylolyticus 1221n]|uniref:Uncharacterized protein n=1 Tax=Desulfurococcus amylolyticus (strain DSM 18924 / JCM 16383 / VKM B-2413 / 1221n) TaxID=490899 RepID=B8D3K2_DESA1|nr:hypothetical protein DKAM_0357 [Desulfurococcus amylolyticus 1221n]
MRIPVYNMKKHGSTESIRAIVANMGIKDIGSKIPTETPTP